MCIFFICSTTDEHLVCFHSLAYYKSAMTMEYIDVFESVFSSSLDKSLLVELMDQMVILFLIC